MKTLPPNGLIIEQNPAIAAAIRDYQRCGGAHFWTVYSPHNGRYTGIIASAATKDRAKPPSPTPKSPPSKNNTRTRTSSTSKTTCS